MYTLFFQNNIKNFYLSRSIVFLKAELHVQIGVFMCGIAA